MRELHPRVSVWARPYAAEERRSSSGVCWRPSRLVVRLVVTQERVDPPSCGAEVPGQHARVGVEREGDLGVAEQLLDDSGRNVLG